MNAPFVMPAQKPVPAGRVACPKCLQTGTFIWKQMLHGIPVVMSGPCSLCATTGSTTLEASRAHIQRGRDARAALTTVAEAVPGVDDLPF